MKVTELRTGVLVSHPANHKFKVGEVRTDYVDELGWHDNGQYLISELDGVRLTEQLIKQMGFDNTIDEPLEEESELLTYFLGNFSIEIIPDKMGLKNAYKFCYYEDMVDEEGNLGMEGTLELDVEYVHQVQNLMSAINGTEITL